MATNSEPHDFFRAIDILPDAFELSADHVPVLRKNIAVGAYGDGVDQYLDVQFRLLREDFIRPLRENIIKYIRTKKVDGKTNIHTNVFIKRRGKSYICSLPKNNDGKVFVSLTSEIIYEFHPMKLCLISFEIHITVFRTPINWKKACLCASQLMISSRSLLQQLEKFRKENLNWFLNTVTIMAFRRNLANHLS